MRKSLLAIFSTLILAGCSTSAPAELVTESVQLTVPQNCENEIVLAAFNLQIPGSKYVPTGWQPAQGTDLYDIYQAHGIACSYGIQSAEIGGTVMWAKSDLALWNTRKSQWLEGGQHAIDIPGVDESEAFITKDGATSADGMHAWAINLFIDGVWIQIGAAFINNIEQAVPIIQAAIDSLEK